ncbi:MAG: sugar ABC transporter permease [Clostridia bacterium]|nr:sugar ABC transporter permease [Clostridia bacterium]
MFELYSLASIPLLLVFVFAYIPMFGIIIAFKNYKFNKGIFGSEWCGFDNFKFLFVSDDFPIAVRNTLMMNSIFIVVGILAALTVAVLLFNIKSRNATKVYQTILITPNFLSWVIVAYMVYALLQPSYGILNGILQSVGLAGVDWYSEPGYWPVILTITNIWKHVGMDSVVYYAALMGVDESLLEAAEIDGASRFRKVYHVMIPTIVPLIIMLTILKIGGIFNADFGLFYQIPRNLPVLYETTDVVSTFVFRAMREIGDMGMSSASGLLQSVVGFVLVIITNYASKKINEEGSLF